MLESQVGRRQPRGTRHRRPSCWPTSGWWSAPLLRGAAAALRARTARLRIMLLLAYLAISVGAGLFVGTQGRGGGLAADPALAPPERLRRRRSAVPPRRGLLRLLAAALPEGRPLAVPHRRGHARLLVRRARRDRRDPHEAGAGVGHARRARPPARARRPAAPRRRLAALAQPVRARASARRAPSCRARRTRTCTSSFPWIRVLVAVSRRVGGRRSCTRPCGGPGRSPAIALVVVAVAELGNPSIAPSVVQRFFVDPQTLSRERPYLAHSVKFTQRALRARSRGRAPASRERHDLPRGAQGQPGRAPQHPALGHATSCSRRSTSSSRSAPTTTSRTSPSTGTATTESHGR